MTTEPATPLPLWRAVTGFGALAAMFVVLAMLAPAYVQNYRMQQWMRGWAHRPGIEGIVDPVLDAELAAKATEFNGPLLSHEVKVERFNGGANVQFRYAIEKNFALYRVDLHFRSSASSR